MDPEQLPHLLRGSRLSKNTSIAITVPFLGSAASTAARLLSLPRKTIPTEVMNSLRQLAGKVRINGFLPLAAVLGLTLLYLAAWQLSVTSPIAVVQSGARLHLLSGTVADNGQTIVSLILSPGTIAAGKSSTGMITVRYPVSDGGGTILLSTGAPSNVSVPTQVRIAAGKTSAHFPITTKPVASPVQVNVSASFAGTTEKTTLTLLPAGNRDWFVDPAGRPTNQGTKTSPWDLATALAHGPGGNEINGGDTVWLRGGRYVGTFTSRLAGKENAPIIVRSSAGERVVIDKASVSETKQPALKVKGPWVWFWGIEIMNSHPDRRRNSPYGGGDRPWRGSGADIYAPNVKFINMIFHDNGQGIWDKQDMTEVHGCLFFYNGNNKREHALYIGNAAGTKYITDNILFDQAGYGILAHSDSSSSSQRGLHLEGNVSFNNGVLTLDDQKTGNLQVGGVSGVSAERVVLKNNYIYNSSGNANNKNHGIRLGYEDVNNNDVQLLDNFIVSQVPLRIGWWRRVNFQGNTIYSEGESVELIMPAGVKASAYRWNFNTYLSSQPNFKGDFTTSSFERWRQLTGFDSHSKSATTRRPSGVRVFVRPNQYEAGRANIIVYNWDLRTRSRWMLVRFWRLERNLRSAMRRTILAAPLFEGHMRVNRFFYL